MTHDNLLTLLRAQANRNANDTTSTTLLRLSIRMALGQASRKKPVTHSANFRLTVVANQIDYSLPTTNIAGTAINLVAFDKQSFRAKGVGEIPFEPATRLDKESPEWLDTAEQVSGSIEAISYIENQFKVYRPATSAFVTANPYIYGRGFRQVKRPSADGAAAATGEVEWSAQIDLPFEDWHEGILQGSLYWTFLNARMPDEAAKVNERFWKPFLTELEDFTVAHGAGVDQLGPAGQFVDVLGTGGSDDYGQSWPS